MFEHCGEKWMWHCLFFVRFSAPWQCDMTDILLVFITPDYVTWPIILSVKCPWQGDMTYFLSVSLHPDNVTLDYCLLFECILPMWHDLFLTMWHDLFSFRVSASWQCDIKYVLSVLLHPDNVTLPLFCLFQCPLTMTILIRRFTHSTFSFGKC